MNTPNQPDPLAAMKQSSPGDPIIPVFEHIHSRLDETKSYAKSIARDAAYLRNTRNLIFVIACSLSAGAGSAGTWYAMRANPSPDIEILRRTGIEVNVTDANNQVRISFGGRIPTPSSNPPTATSKGALILTWNKP